MIRFSGRVSVLAGMVLIAAAFAWGRPGAASQQDSPGTTTLQVYSRLTVVDVTATDSSGRPVHGLRQSDFTLLEDATPEPIRNFEEIRSQPVQPPRPMPPNIYTNLQPPSPSSAVNLMLLDFANEAPVDSTDPKQLSRSLALQKRVKDGAMQALQAMPAGTRVAILEMTNHLRILQSFTSNQALLVAAIDAVDYDLDGNGDRQCVQSNNRNRMVLEAFDQIAASSAAIHGRKNLIWFTIGIPAITNPGERPECLPDYSLGLSQAYDLLAQSQVSVYPIYAPGVDRLGSAQLSLESVAEATGGIAYAGTNGLADTVVKAIDHGANYYSIAYIPPTRKYDGAYHKIKVTVDRPGVTLVFRKGYYADDLAKNQLTPGLTLSITPPPVLAGSMKAPMSRGMATSTGLLFDVGIEPSRMPPKPSDPPVMGTLDPRLKGKHLTRYGFQYAVPAQQIAFVSGPNRTHRGSLDFDIAVYDNNDKLLTGLSQSVKTTLSDTTYQQQMKNRAPIQLFQQIDLPPGQLFLRVGVLDRISNKVGTLELPLKVGKK